MRALGDTTTRFDRFEAEAGKPLADLDTTTPRAIVETLWTLLLGDVLSASSRAKLEELMAGNEVGRSRLRAAFPTE